MCFLFCRFWLIDIFIFSIPRVYTQVTSTEVSIKPDAYQVTRDITIATLYLLYDIRAVKETSKPSEIISISPLLVLTSPYIGGGNI